MPLSSKPLVVRTALRNDLPVVTVSLPHLHVGHVMLFVRCGPRFESEETHGLSHFLEHMVFRGAGRFPSSPALARTVEDACGQLDAATYRDYTVFSSPYAPGQLRRVLEVMAAMALEPLFRSLEVERRIVLEELRELEDEDGAEIDAENLSRGLLFGGHALARRIDGTSEKIQSFGIRDLRSHHRRCYVARNMALVVAGPERPALVERCARRALAGLDPGERLPLGPPPGLMRRAPRFSFVARDGSQTEVRFGFRTPGERSPQAAALMLARRVLDDGVGSRLQSELVERRGLAYELWADLELAPDIGVLDFGALVAHHKVESTVRAMLASVRRLAREGPTLEELRRAKRRAVWAFRAAIDSPASLGEWIGRGVLFDLSYDIAQTIARAKALRREQIQKALRGVLDAGGFGLVAVGKTPRGARVGLRRAARALPHRVGRRH